MSEHSLGATAYAVQTPLWRFVSDFRDSRAAVGGSVVLAAIVTLALLAPLIAPQDPYDLAQVDILDSLLRPGSRGDSGRFYLLGTDDQGRDMLSAILFGLRTSVFVGITSAVLGMCVGTCIGLGAAFAGGRTDAVLMRIVDIQISFPTTLIALLLLALLGKGTEKIILALVLVQWAYYARTARGSALVEMRKEYVEAARCLMLPRWRILFRHVLTNCLPPLIVVLTVQIAHAISLEATLSFLGLGLPVTQPSLGLLISNGYQYLLSGLFWISAFPGIALLVTIVAFNLVGDHVRDVLNPRFNR
jgi:peptide/nickel transport system permease protein